MSFIRNVFDFVCLFLFVCLFVQARHKQEVEQIRSAGHDALAVIVEEYKVGNGHQV